MLGITNHIKASPCCTGVVFIGAESKYRLACLELLSEKRLNPYFSCRTIKKTCRCGRTQCIKTTLLPYNDGDIHEEVVCATRNKQ